MQALKKQNREGAHWEKLAKKPKKVRLITTAELDQLCQAALLSEEALELLPKRVRHLRAEQAITGQNFSDYLRLLAYCGGREPETLQQRWSHVDWQRRVLHFPGGKRGGGSQEAGEPRDIDFNRKLEEHLKAMYNRRDPDSDYLCRWREMKAPPKALENNYHV